MDRRTVLAGMGGAIGAGLAGCTDLTASNPSLVAAIDVEENDLGSGEYPLESVTVEVEVDASWSQLSDPPDAIEIGVRTGPDDTAIIDHRETGSWETEDSQVVFGLTGDLMDVHDPESFESGEHTVPCTLGVALYRDDASLISEEDEFEVTFTVEGEEDPDDLSSGDDDTDDEEADNSTDEGNDDAEGEEGEEGNEPGDTGTSALEDVRLFARDPNGRASDDYCDAEENGRQVIGHATTEDGTLDAVPIGTDGFTISWENLPDSVPIVTWTGTIDGIERQFGYETGPFIANPDEPWPTTHTQTWDGGGRCRLFSPERRWLEGGPIDDIEVGEPGTTEFFPLDVTFDARVWPDEDIARDDVEPMAEPTHDETVLLAVTYLDPAMDVSAVIDGEVE